MFDLNYQILCGHNNMMPTHPIVNGVVYPANDIPYLRVAPSILFSWSPQSGPDQNEDYAFKY